MACAVLCVRFAGDATVQFEFLWGVAVVQSLGGRCMSSNNISYQQKGDKTQTTRCRSSREKRKTCPKKHPPSTGCESHISTPAACRLYGMPAATSTTAAQICTSTCTACACAVCACQIVTDVHRRMSMLINSCCAERKVRSERAMSHVVPTLLAFKVRTMAREQRGQCHTGTAGADRAVPEPPGTPPAIGQQKGA